MVKDDGGQAFPSWQKWTTFGYHGHEEQSRGPLHDGLSLRDYFAGQALAGLLANPTWANDCARLGEPSTPGAAHAAYEYADAMLEARKP